MRISLNRIHYPVTALGHGTRVGIWVQGCSIRCPGCSALDTWAADPDRALDVADIVEACRSISTADLDGVTISGGEPFDQPEGLLALIVEVRSWLATVPRPTDILCFSGRTTTVLRCHHPGILALLDAVVTGPFLVNSPTSQALRGSDNQELVTLTDLGRTRYEGIDATKPRIQLAATADEIFMIGIPRRGDLERLTAIAEDSGLKLLETTWMS